MNRWTCGQSADSDWVCQSDVESSKCVLFSTKVFFLGHSMSKEVILLDQENVAKILNWLVPKTVCDV